jgi:galactokinase
VLALLGGGHVLSGPALASIAQRAERDFVGVDSGIVDLMASAACREDRAMLLDCRTLETRHTTLPYGVEVVICDTGERSVRRAPELLARRADCARVVALLAERLPGLCSLRDLDVASLRRHAALLPEGAARRAEHVVAENARVVATAAALEAGDLAELGRLFAESHASLRDLYEVSTPALDAMVDVAGSVPGVVASRMTGAGFGGCTVNLVLTDAVPALEAAVAGEYVRRTGLKPRVYAVALVAGAGPVAGL